MSTQFIKRFIELTSCIIIVFMFSYGIEAEKGTSTTADNICERTITHLAISPDSSLLATSNDVSSSIDVWNLTTLSLVTSIPLSEDYVADISFSPDNRILAWSSSNNGLDGSSMNGSVYLYDLHTNSIIASLKNVADVAYKLNILDDDKTLLFLGAYPGYERADVQIWNVISKANIAKFEAWDIAAAFSENNLDTYMGTTLSLGITNEFSYQIEEWDGQNNLVLRKVEVPKPISALALNDDQSLIAFGDKDGLISLWSTSTLAPLTTFQSQDNSVEYLSFTKEDQLLSVGQDGTRQNIRVWNINSKPLISAQRSFEGNILEKSALKSDEPVLIIANGEGEPFGFSLWNYETGISRVVELSC